MVLDNDNLKEKSKIFNHFNITDKYITSTAFYHSSSFTNQNDKDTYNKLIFVGTEVVVLIAADYIFFNITQNAEELSKLIASIKKELTISICEHYNIKQFVIFLKNTDKNEFNYRDSVHAIVAAIYLQNGYKFVYEMIIPILSSVINRKYSNPLKDPKTQLQEIVQRKKGTAIYTVTKEEGPDHDKTFYVMVEALSRYSYGKGPSKKVAEKEAATNYLIKYYNKELTNVEHNNKSPYVMCNDNSLNNHVRGTNLLTNFFPAQLSLINQSLVHKSNKNSSIYNNSSLACLGTYVQAVLYVEYIYTNTNNSNIVQLKSYLMSQDTR